MAEEIVSRLISFATELISNAWSCEEELRGLDQGRSQEFLFEGAKL